MFIHNFKCQMNAQAIQIIRFESWSLNLIYICHAFEVYTYIKHREQCQGPLPVREIPGVVGVEGTEDPGGPEEVVVTVVAVVVVTAEDCWVVDGVRLTGAALGSPLLSKNKITRHTKLNCISKFIIFYCFCFEK